MNWLFALPGLFLLLLVALYAAGGKNRERGLFRQALPQLLLLILLSAAIALLSSAWLQAFHSSRRLLFLAWLAFWFFLLAAAIKTLAYFIFDFLVLKREGIRYPRLVKDVVVFLLYIAGVLLILKYYLGVHLTGLLASTAVLTVVVGFALQDVLGNLFSGIILNFEDSFKLGDWLRIGEREGRVEQFGWRSFKIRTIDRELIVIPNQSASKAEVLIYGAGHQPVALRIGVGASYQDSPDRVSAAILGALETITDVCREPQPVVQLEEFADFSLNYIVKFWINDYSRHNIIASEVRRHIWYAFRRSGIEIPYPKRDVIMKQERREEIPRAAVEEVLRRNEVLREIGKDEVRLLLEAAETRVFGSGESIIREGLAGDHFHHLYSGAATVLKNGEVVARLGAGDFFGEISLVTGEKTNATVVAEGECTVLLISAALFRQVVDMNEKTALKLSSVITRRQEEMRLFSERSLVVDGAALQKKSENLFRRILKYFASKK